MIPKNMNKIQTFNFKHDSIQVVIINNIIYFVGRDIVSVLQYKRDTVLGDICKKAIVNSNIDMLNSKAILLSESDVYRLILKSKSSDADIFLDWITDTVLPTVRRQIYLDELKKLIELEEFKLQSDVEEVE